MTSLVLKNWAQEIFNYRLKSDDPIIVRFFYNVPAGSRRSLLSLSLSISYTANIKFCLSR